MNRLVNSTLLRTLLLTAAFASLDSPLSFAHEQKTSLTDLFYNERSGNLEIAHRFRLHDAEHTLHKATDSRGDLTLSEEARKAFARYAAERFTLTLENKKQLPLTLVGQELEGGYLWVYQETPIPEPVSTSFFIQNTILLDVVKGQVNTVNVRYRSQVSTFVFQVGTGRKLFEGARP